MQKIISKIKTFAIIGGIIWITTRIYILHWLSAYATSWGDVSSSIQGLTQRQRLERYKLWAFEELYNFKHVWCYPNWRCNEELRWFVAWKLAIIWEAVAKAEGGYKNVLWNWYHNRWSLSCNPRGLYHYKCYKRWSWRWAAIFRNDEEGFKQFVRTWIVNWYSSHNLIRAAKRYAGNWRIWYKNVKYWICKIDDQSFYYLCK